MAAGLQCGRHVCRDAGRASRCVRDRKSSVGAKDWMVVYAAGDVREALKARPTLDRDATRALVARLHPRHQITELEDGSLLEHANPPDGHVYAACLPGVTLLCTGE